MIIHPLVALLLGLSLASARTFEHCDGLLAASLRANRESLAANAFPAGAFASPRFQHLGGRLLEQIGDAELGKFDLITDNLGPYSYTQQIDVVLQKYIDLLHVNGLAFIRGVNVHSGLKPTGLIQNVLAMNSRYRQHLDDQRLTIKTENGPRSVLEWLRSHDGISVRSIENWPDDVIVIQKVAERPERLGRLKLTGFKTGRPPQRRYTAVP